MFIQKSFRLARISPFRLRAKTHQGTPETRLCPVPLGAQGEGHWPASGGAPLERPQSQSPPAPGDAGGNHQPQPSCWLFSASLAQQSLIRISQHSPSLSLPQGPSCPALTRGLHTSQLSRACGIILPAIQF